MMKKRRTIDKTKRAKCAKPRSPKTTVKASVGNLVAECRQWMEGVDNARSELERNEFKDRLVYFDRLEASLSHPLTRLEKLVTTVADLKSLTRELEAELRSSGCGNRQLVYFRVVGRRNSRRGAAASVTVAKRAMGKKPTEPGGLRPAPQEEINRLYRLVARRLHPDGIPASAGQASELWHLLQNAYQRQDLERLRLLSVLTEQPCDPVAAKTHLIKIRSARDLLRLAADTVQRKLATAKKHPSWNFTRLADRSIALAAARRQVETDIELLAREQMHLEQSVANWSRAARGLMRTW